MIERKTPFCPRMSIVSPPPTSALISNPATADAKAHLVPCRGAECAFFIHDIGADGKPTGRGGCADSIQAFALMRIMQVLEENFGDDPDEDDAGDQPTVDHITPQSKV